MAVDRDDYGRFIGGIAFPMYVVTAAAEGQRAGCLLAFASRVNLDPPRFLVSVSKQNRTCEVARHATHLAVHTLREDQRGLAELFGGETGEDLDKFARCDWSPGPDGVPLLADCPGLMVGRVLQRIDWGDHVGHLLDPVETRSGPGGPGMTFLDVRDIPPGHEG